MIKFVKYTIRWIASNLSIPFWTCGHVAISIHYNILKDIEIIISSLGMNILVSIGFWLEWIEYKNSLK
jgi:hypothetical protein